MNSMESIIIYMVTLGKEKSPGSFYISLQKGNVMTALEQRKIAKAGKGSLRSCPLEN